MIAEIISTGSELLLGHVTNTTAPYIARQLNGIGIDVLYQSTVGDNRQRMAEVIKAAVARADLIITTGGLGPTRGDITKEVAAEAVGRELGFDRHSADRIEGFFRSRGRVMTDNNLRQAWFAEGAIIFDNDVGTAPSCLVELTAGKFLVHLPGPPHETEWALKNHILPWLSHNLQKSGITLSRILHTIGVGESMLEHLLAGLVDAAVNPTMAFLVSRQGVNIRITAKAGDCKMAESMLSRFEQSIRMLVGQYIYGIDDETLESLIGNKLSAWNKTVAVAESCTGGLLSGRIVDVPGSSAYFKGGLVCYTNEAKIDIAGVNERTLTQYGAVSAETARELAVGARSVFKADYGIGVTGIAGPAGNAASKPTGLVYIAVTVGDDVRVEEYKFAGTRNGVRNQTVLNALNMLRLVLKNDE